MIFEDINELENCVKNWEGIFPDKQFIKLLSTINKIKTLDYSDETKQHLINNNIRKLLLMNDIVSSSQVIDWLNNKVNEYRDMLKYIRKEKQWREINEESRIYERTERANCHKM